MSLLSVTAPQLPRMAVRRLLASSVFALCLALPVRAEGATDLAQLGNFIELMSHYYALMESIHGVAADPDKSAVLQMTKLKEFLENSGQRDRVPDVLRKIADGSTRPAVRNAATMMLAEALNERGETRAAAAVLERALLATLAP